jgi:hypothetical protein
MSEPTFDVFLSHSNSNRSWSRVFASELRSRGCNVFFDEDSVDEASSVEEQIRGALKNSRAVVSVLDRSSAGSNWAAFEVGAAIAARKPILSVVSHDVPSEYLPGPVRSLPQLEMATPGATASEVMRILEADLEPFLI